MPPVHSTLEIYDLAQRQRRALLSAPRHLEAPNWSRDGQFLVVNGDGLLYRVPLDAPPGLNQPAAPPGTALYKPVAPPMAAFTSRKKLKKSGRLSAVTLSLP